jgi:hypothetical protein
MKIFDAAKSDNLKILTSVNVSSTNEVAKQFGRNGGDQESQTRCYTIAPLFNNLWFYSGHKTNLP